MIYIQPALLAGNSVLLKQAPQTVKCTFFPPQIILVSLFFFICGKLIRNLIWNHSIPAVIGLLRLQ